MTDERPRALAPSNSESVPSPLLTGEPGEQGAQLPVNTTEAAEHPPSAALPESGVTLLDDLEWAAIALEAFAATMRPTGREAAKSRAGRLRAARERLESEMQRWRESGKYTNAAGHWRVVSVLDRINGGGPHGR